MSRMESSKPARRVRRRFTDEFKAGAIRLVLADEGKTVGAVARDLDLTASSVAEWVKRTQADRTKGRTGPIKEEREESRGLLREAEPVRFRFIAAEKAHHTVSVLCRCLQVTPSDFYAWRRRPESTRARAGRRLKVLIGASLTPTRAARMRARTTSDCWPVMASAAA